MFAKKIFLLVLCTLALSTAFAQDFNKYDYIKTQIDNEVSFRINFQSQYQISSLTLDNYFYPQTYNNSQYLNDFTTTHRNYELIKDLDSYFFRYDLSQSAEPKNTITNTFTLQSTVDRPKISYKVPYPLSSVNSKYDPYLEFSGLITIDENIRKQATKLAEGESDTYVIASKIAKWIREDIDYDLSTVTQDPDQTSSEVFVSKAGVCKEITHLYISMMRSLGIPARVVTGYAYTNSQEVIDFVGSPWGGHAWAEVLIGDTWVPFDLTYNQYGFVDATHIVLDKSPSIRPNSIKINGSGRGFTLVDGSLRSQTEFEVLEEEETLFEHGFTLSIDGPKELAPNSYGYLNATVKNSRDFYQVLFLQVAKTSEVELLSRPEQMMIFEPNESKQLLLTYKLPQLDENYIYTFPFLLYNDFLEEEFEIKVQNGNLQLEKNQLPIIEEKRIEFSKQEIELYCSGEFLPVNNNVSCTLKNPNNYEIKNSTLCVEQSCKNVNLLINEEKNYEFKTPDFTPRITFNDNTNTLTQQIFIKKPTLQTSIDLNGNTVIIEASHTSEHDLTFELFVNNKSINSIIGKDILFEEKLDVGKQNIEVKLTNQKTVFDSKKATILVEELSLIDKIILFFKKVGSYF